MGFYVRNIIRLSIRHFCVKNNSNVAMKYLNVAEKNDAAKNIAAILSKGASNRREGLSPYNKIYEFNCQVFGENASMVMTSVSGHLLNYEFSASFRSWQSCNPAALFDAPILKSCPEGYEKIKKTLEREIRSCHGLIIWTDCDREGENIGFEIIKVCTDIKPNIPVYRAKFSEITRASIFRALSTLGQPNKNVSDAVDVRQELDLRTGAAFTRLQTLRFQKAFPNVLNDKLISYGSCQFPTLGFVVERYQAIENFIPEPFWRIKMSHKDGDLITEFHWVRDRLFDKTACEAILDICEENPLAKVEKVESKPKSKWRPLPLDTVEMEKTVSKKLRINAKETMRIAEKLYNQGFISYPRTETNIFPKEMNLGSLVELQQGDRNWGTFANRIMNEGGPNPRQGKKSDQAHPPIHPIKHADSLTGNEQKVYEYIVRHFLACLHKDAQGYETIVTVNLADEIFTTKGLIILEKNYLDVYIYEKWSGKEIPNFQVGQEFTPHILELAESTTTAPKLLTEAELIALMDRHGIGTDATHAEHIDTIKSREYVGLHENLYFVPGTLGMGLVEGYNKVGHFSLAKPDLRAEFENDLKLICDGLKNAETVRTEQIRKYKAVFEEVVQKIQEIDRTLSHRLSATAEAIIDNNGSLNMAMPTKILTCPKCGSDMMLRDRKNGGKCINCDGFPACRNAIWFNQNVERVEPVDELCSICGNVKKLKFKFKQNLFPGEPNPNVYCIGGCDINVLQTFDIALSTVRGNNTRTNTNSNNNNNTTLNTTNQWPRTATQANFGGNNPQRNPPRTNGTTNINNTSLMRPNTSFPVPPSTGTADEIVCNCGQNAILRTVSKDGVNKGRKFYTCESRSCEFFLWASDDAQPNTTTHTNMNMNTTRTNNNNINRNNTTITGQDEVKCNCNIPAVLRTVSKAGPNVGRQFYCCSKGQQGGCGFFKWAEQGDNAGRGHQGGDDFGGGGGGGGNTRTVPKKQKATGPAAGQPRAKRKCGICGQEGHIRTKCPNK